MTKSADISPLILGLIESGTDVNLTVTGDSMRPMLRHNRDSVVLTACNPLSLKKGDLPLYKRNDGKIILHRIVKVNEKTFNCCGDHQSEIEKDVPKGNVVAVVKSFTRRGKSYSVSDKRYIFYVRLWTLSRPLRKVIFFLWSKLVTKKC